MSDVRSSPFLEGAGARPRACPELPRTRLDDDPAGRLDRRYRGALLAVGALVLLDQVVVEPPLLRLLTDAPTINIAGRQRMLSQRLAKTALAIELAETEADRDDRRRELGEILRAWSAAHDRLRHQRQSPALLEAFARLDPSYARLREAAETIGDTEGETRRVRSTILALESEYLARMERIVGIFEREASARVDRLLWMSRGLTALVLLALSGIGRLILRPASRLIRRQVSELVEARDALEARVLERTEALERANQALKHESLERARAEARQRALLEQFSHSARTTTLGEMASGLAHELGQPLGAIANYAEGCLVAPEGPAPKPDALREAIAKILATTLRAGEIVRRIRRFVTRQGPATERFDPNRLVVEVEDFLRDEADRQQIALGNDLAPDLPYLQGDPVQIQQVLVNLVRNAIEALEAAKPQNPSVVMRTERLPSGAVSFSVSDNGEGIPAECLDRVFDAYFSTRDEGMGMGLAISRTIVEAHHGRIEVESLPGTRTTFRFTLPTGVDAGVEFRASRSAEPRPDADPDRPLSPEADDDRDAGADRLHRR